jgi:hypothetical protein
VIVSLIARMADELHHWRARAPRRRRSRGAATPASPAPRPRRLRRSALPAGDPRLGRVTSYS